jgi:hypothetical protein
VHLVPSPCIADIPNRMRMIREAGMSFAQSCGSRRRFALAGIFFRAAALLAVLALLPPRSSAQSAAGPASLSPGQQPPPANKANAEPKPKAKAKAKKVYTNDDLEKPSARVEQPSSGEVDYYGGLLTCDAACEKRASLNVYIGGPAAWDAQIATSRKRLAADTEWREQLRKTIELQRIYCNYINPQSRKGTPGAKSFDAQIAAEADAYMKKTGVYIDETFQSLAAQMRRRVNEVRFSDPQTGSMMDVQYNQVTQCSPYVP